MVRSSLPGRRKKNGLQIRPTMSRINLSTSFSVDDREKFTAFETAELRSSCGM